MSWRQAHNGGAAYGDRPAVLLLLVFVHVPGWLLGGLRCEAGESEGLVAILVAALV